MNDGRMDMRNQDAGNFKKTVESWQVHKGKGELIRHLDGEVLTRSEAMAAYCYECNCGYDGGARDCGMNFCPLHTYMPFNAKKVKKTRDLTDEQRKAIGDRLRNLKLRNPKLRKSGSESLP